MINDEKLSPRDLENCLNYTGMEKDLRKIAIKNKLDKVENIAVMTTYDICELILKSYCVVFTEEERIGLVKKENLSAFKNLMEIVSR